ncbi:Hypothetical predicted protein [Mytilus galloprovincialis]|uniref:Novel STAND NTPase 3 domain-containing protein n=1 Tax=Mytilus galloprovincialis TaxID=29158 RepID=A0A8B6F6N8_MYTGA|nr:Hypothetical predicted protein [Mytilus galloprovincialis]
MFVNTRAAKHVLQSLQENSCVTVTASSGVGKTAIIQHVALEMYVIGYDILLVTDPGDIVKFYNPNKKTLFVIDNLCGNFSLNQIDIKIWEPVVSRIKECLEDKHTKIIAACRLQVYLDDKFDTLSIFKTCVCNLMSDTIRLLIPEKQSIAELYLKTKAYQVTDYYDLYDCFPLLCQLYNENPTLDLKDLFQNPFSVYEAQVDELQKKGIYAKYCALALCVVFNNKVNEDILTLEIGDETRNIIENTCEACKLDRGTSRLLLKDEMDSLLNTFLQKQGITFRYLENQIFYTTMHDKVFDILVKCFGQKLFDCLIKNADSGLIRERFLLDRKDDMDQCITIVSFKYHQVYMQRMIDDWSKGKLQDVFNNNNMKLYQFRQRFLSYLNKYDISFQKKLVHTVDLNYNKYNFVGNQGYDKDVICDTVMLLCCFIGDIPMIQFCLGHDASIDQCGYRGQFP